MTPNREGITNNQLPLSTFEVLIENKWVPLEEMAAQCGMEVEKLKAAPVETSFLCVSSVDSSYMIGNMYLSNWRHKKSESANMLTGVSAGDMVVCW